MSLSDRLEELSKPGSTVGEANYSRVAAPSGWEPGVKFQADGTRIVTLPPSVELGDESSWTAAVDSLGVTVPSGFRVRLVESKYDPAAWTRDDSEQKLAVTKAVWRYRFVVEVCPARVDVDDLLRAVGQRRGVKTIPEGNGLPVFCVAAGDLQLGKSDGDGSAGTVNRFLDAHANSFKRYKELRKRGKCEQVLILWAGDCIEGNTSQGGNLIGRNDLTLTEQLRVYRRLMMEQVKSFADIAEKVTVAVVPGNHDEVLRIGNQMASRYDDSWAIEGASQVADVMASAGYENVGWVFPGRDELDLCIDVNGVKIGLMHGHQTRGKIETWLGGAAVQRRAIGTSDVLISGHYHHLKIQQLGPTTHIQLPALDGGSLWWRHKGGLDAPPGVITFIIDNGWRGLEIL